MARLRDVVRQLLTPPKRRRSPQDVPRGPRPQPAPPRHSPDGDAPGRNGPDGDAPGRNGPDGDAPGRNGPDGDAAGRNGPDGDAAGRYGPDATTEAQSVGAVHTSYNPSTDGDPDPGEIVWTWVPYEENDGRGKDRPVLIVAVEPSGTLLAVQLTSKNHDGEGDWVPLGAGRWDGEHRPSWADISRVLRVHRNGMRREAAALDREPFDSVIEALRLRYGWR